MTQLASIKTLVQGEECGVTAVPQKGKKLLVLHAFSANFVADLSERYMPPS